MEGDAPGIREVYNILYNRMIIAIKEKEASIMKQILCISLKSCCHSYDFASKALIQIKCTTFMGNMTLSHLGAAL